VADGFREKTQGRVTRYDGGSAVAAFEQGIAGIYAQRRKLLRWAMAGDAPRNQDRPDLLLEELDGF